MKLSTNNLDKTITRIALGVLMIGAGIGHFTFLRAEFQAQAPDWIPLSKDLVVLLSGFVEICLGLGMLFLKKQKKYAGLALALFFLLIFPGNIYQYQQRIDAFGLTTDALRFQRLLFQPVLILLTLWSTNWFVTGKNKTE